MHGFHIQRTYPICGVLPSPLSNPQFANTTAGNIKAVKAFMVQSYCFSVRFAMNLFFFHQMRMPIMSTCRLRSFHLVIFIQLISLVLIYCNYKQIGLI